MRICEWRGWSKFNGHGPHDEIPHFRHHSRAQGIQTHFLMMDSRRTLLAYSTNLLVTTFILILLVLLNILRSTLGPIQNQLYVRHNLKIPKKSKKDYMFYIRFNNLMTI